ncbi:hypothetical protein Tco_0963518 [Tanacetum coccineum]
MFGYLIHDNQLDLLLDKQSVNCYRSRGSTWTYLVKESSRTGCRKAEEAEWDGGMVSEACRDVLDNTVFRLAYLAVSLRFSYLVVGWVDDEMADVILDDLLQKEFNEHEHVKDDKGKGPRIESVDNIEKRIKNVRSSLQGKKQMIMKKGKRVLTEIYIKICYSVKLQKLPQILQVVHSKTEMCKWYLSTSSDEDSTTNEDSSSDDYMTVFKGKTGSSSNLSKAKTRSSSKHLTASARSKKVDVGASTWSFTLLVLTKRPPLVRNFILGLSAVNT